MPALDPIFAARDAGKLQLHRERHGLHRHGKFLAKQRDSRNLLSISHRPVMIFTRVADRIASPNPTE